MQPSISMWLARWSCNVFVYNHFNGQLTFLENYYIMTNTKKLWTKSSWSTWLFSLHLPLCCPCYCFWLQPKGLERKQQLGLAAIVAENGHVFESAKQFQSSFFVIFCSLPRASTLVWDLYLQICGINFDIVRHQ